jgi:hypothetical protein
MENTISKNGTKSIFKNIKIIALSFLIIFFFAIKISSVSATSGACSNHGGVNCSIGFDSATGNAICNDDFVSSVSYSNMDECDAGQAHCPLPDAKTSCDQGSVNSYQNSYDQCVQQHTQSAQKLADGLSMNCGRSGGTECYFNPTPDLSSCDLYSSKAQLCKLEMNKFDTDMQTYKQCWKNYDDSLDIKFQLKMNSGCVSTYGPNSHYDPTNSTGTTARVGFCSCQSGYMIDSNWRCSPQQQVKQASCFSKYGPGGQYNSSTDKCTCISGDVIDMYGQCVKEELPNLSTTKDSSNFDSSAVGKLFKDANGSTPKKTPKKITTSSGATLDNIFKTPSTEKNNTKGSFNIFTGKTEKPTPTPPPAPKIHWYNKVWKSIWRF